MIEGKCLGADGIESSDDIIVEGSFNQMAEKIPAKQQSTMNKLEYSYRPQLVDYLTEKNLNGIIS